MVRYRKSILLVFFTLVALASLPLLIIVSVFTLGSEEGHLEVLTNRPWSYLGGRLLMNIAVGIVMSIALSLLLWLLNKTLLEREKVNSMRSITIYFITWTVLSLIAIALFNFA